MKLQFCVAWDGILKGLFEHVMQLIRARLCSAEDWCGLPSTEAYEPVFLSKVAY